MNVAKHLIAAALPCLVAVAQVPTSSQAVALVKSAVSYAKKNGVQKLLDETNSPNGKFHVSSGGELYIFIYDERGFCKAIGFQTEKFLGVNRIGIRDPDGFPILVELIKMAKDNGRGWVDYKYANPTNGQQEQKTSYVEYYEGLTLGCGIYKEKD